MTKSGTQLCGVCQSRFTSTDCIHIPGAGVTDDPNIPEWIVDPTADNLVHDGPNGLTGVLPPIYLDPPSALVRGVIDQTIPINMEWPLIYHRSVYDTDNMWTRDAPERLTFRTEGLYFITVNVRWTKTDDNSATGYTAVYIRLNEDNYVALDAQQIPNGDLYPHQSLHAIVPAKADDSVATLVKCAAFDADDEPIAMRITAERQSPIFTATYMRSLDGLTIPGY